MHVQSCCFADLNLLFFDALVAVAVDVPKLPVVSHETSDSYNLCTRINRSFVFKFQYALYLRLKPDLFTLKEYEQLSLPRSPRWRLKRDYC